jgi:hypothetical protein
VSGDLPPIECYADEPLAHATGSGVTAADTPPPVALTDFYAYLPDHRYIFIPTRELWPAASINARLPAIETGTARRAKPSEWLDQHASVEQMTWAPGEPMLIEDRLISEGGWMLQSLSSPNDHARRSATGRALAAARSSDLSR